jgi:hypothetical protein
MPLKDIFSYLYTRLYYRVKRLHIHSNIWLNILRTQNTKDVLSSFNINSFKIVVREFITTHKVSDDFEFLYSSSCKKPTLYASAYACLTNSIIGDLEMYSIEEKNRWLLYFDKFQSSEDGLFYDPIIDSPTYRNSDWWGARHLTLHMIHAYNCLGRKTKYPLFFLRPYYDFVFIRNWLDNFNWSGNIGMHDDIDNMIMNIGCLLQYQRDTWGDKQAELAVLFLQEYLSKKINPKTGMWGFGYDLNNKRQRSRIVQFAYHIYPIFLYDKISIPYFDQAVPFVLKTQNIFGGFGVNLNSSACEDIDSIDILIRTSYLFPQHQKVFYSVLKKAFKWVLLNQVKDGGFVFRLEEEFVYGHQEMSSKKNMGALFPTWFRVLSIAYMTRYFKIEGLKFTTGPGYEF